MKFKNAKSVTALSVALLTTTSTIAADYTTQIATANTDGSANVTAVIAAVIGIAILGFGVKAMMNWFTK
jgi:hypothetical protein